MLKMYNYILVNFIYSIFIFIYIHIYIHILIHVDCSIIFIFYLFFVLAFSLLILCMNYLINYYISIYSIYCLSLEKNWNMKIPGFASFESTTQSSLRPIRKPTILDIHKKRLALINKQKVIIHSFIHLFIHSHLYSIHII